jgi:CheY-like chemotaxis protein
MSICPCRRRFPTEEGRKADSLQRFYGLFTIITVLSTMQEAVQSPKTSVLVVDDDEAVRAMLNSLLCQDNYEVETTKSVADALEAIEQTPFDVYVMDFKLPDGTGLDVAERIRSKGSRAPIILMSGDHPNVFKTRAETLKIYGYLQKPFS